MATRNWIRLELDDRGLTPDRRPGLRRHVLRWSERLLILVGVLCLAYFLYTYIEARLYQAFEDRELDEILSGAETTREPAPPAPTRRAIPATGSMVGRIEIPRLGVSAVIRAGSDARTLRLAVGYIPGTALPGDRGNFGLAGHRDTFFRKLREINPDDEIRIVTKDGVFQYYVQRTSIVMPKDVWVLSPTDYPALTLVTCYPFNYIGSAPQRFIVRAALGTSGAAARAGLSKPSGTTSTLRPKRSNVRPVVAKKTATLRAPASKPAKAARSHSKAQTKPSSVRGGLVRVKATTSSITSKRSRTTNSPSTK
jgi:sortase A